MKHEKPNASEFTWSLLGGSTFCPSATHCVRCGSGSRPGLRWSASCLPVRLLRLLPLRLRALRLLWARVVLRRDLHWRRTLVPRVLWPSWILWSLGLLWPLRFQGRPRGSRTGPLRTRPSRWRIPRRLRAWRLCTGRLSRRRTQVDRILDSIFNGRQCTLPAVPLFHEPAPRS
jgi:hypothetical protein